MSNRRRHLRPEKPLWFHLLIAFAVLTLFLGLVSKGTWFSAAAQRGVEQWWKDHPDAKALGNVDGKKPQRPSRRARRR